MNQILECNVCGSNDYFHDDVSDIITCQVCGAVIALEQTQAEQNIAEYQRSLFATTSIASQLISADEFQLDEPISAEASEHTGRTSRRSTHDIFESDGLTDVELINVLNNDADYLRIYKCQQFIIKIISDLHIGTGLPDITKLTVKVWRKYLYKLCQFGASKRYLSLKQSTIASIKIPPLNINMALSLVLLCYVYCGCGIVANDIIRWVYQGTIPFEAFSANLSFKTKPLHSSKYLEFMAIKVNKVVQLDMCKCNDIRFQNLTYRGCKTLCLPKYIAQMAINHWNTHHFSVTQGDTSVRRSNSYIYGIGKFGYPIPVEVAATILFICRRIWPVFIIPPPPLPHKPSTVPPDNNMSNKISLINNKDYLDNLTFDPQRMAWVATTVKPIDDYALGYLSSVLLQLQEQKRLIPKYKPFLCRSFRSITTQLQSMSDTIHIFNNVIDYDNELLYNVKTFNCIGNDMQDALTGAIEYLRENDPIACEYVTDNDKSNFISFKKFVVDYLAEKCHRKFFEGLHNKFYNYADYCKLRCDPQVWLRQRGYWSGSINVKNKDNPEHKLISSNEIYSRILNRFIHSDCWSVENCIDTAQPLQTSDTLNNDLIRAISLVTTGRSTLISDKLVIADDGPWKSLSKDVFNRLQPAIQMPNPQAKLYTSQRNMSKYVPMEVFEIVQNLPTALFTMDTDNGDNCKSVYYELANSHVRDCIGNPTLYVLALVLLANFFGVQKASIHQCIKFLSQSSSSTIVHN